MKSVLRSLVILTAFLLALTSVTSMAQIAGSDNFNDNSKDTSKWGTDVVSGGASLVEANARLEYRVASPDTLDGFDEASRPWILNTARNSDAFDVVLDVFNNVNPTLANNASIGLTVRSRQNAEDSIYLELYRSGPNGDGKGFLAALSSAAAGGEVQPYTTPTSHAAVTTASVRLSYNPSTQIFTAYYDTTGSGDGYQWTAYGSFGVGASGGGSLRNSPWQLNLNQGFSVRVSGFSEGLVVSSGAVYADNFSASTVSNNASLSALALSSGTLTPTFASATTSYTASVSNATTSITVTPTVAQANATVKVNNVTVASGAASGAIALNVGSNTITTVVTAQDGTTTKTYTVNVVRQSSTALGGTDDFADNSRDASKWAGTDVIEGGGLLTETNGRLEYTVGSASPDADGAERRWTLNTTSGAVPFDVVLDVTNTLSPTGFKAGSATTYKNASLGITVTSLENADDSIYMELYRSDPAGDGRGFLASLSTNVLNAQGDHEVLPRTVPSSHPLVTTGCVRLNYNPASKVFTAYYDTDGSGNGYQWQVYGSFGVAGAGGITRNGNWLMTQNLGFQVRITGFSEGLTISSGQVFADNFQAATGLAGWRLATFGSATASGSTADDADPDKDGVVNLVEYATGQNPSASTTLSTPLIPVSGTTIEFYYPRSVAAVAAGTGFVVEWSDTLASGSWSAAGVTQQVLSDNGTLQQVKATLPAGTNSKRFVRLRVVAPGA